MLEEISISDLGVIKKATLPFSRGLTVLTGETGAGKTMVLTGLGLLMGKRVGPSIVRAGATHTSVEGCWQLKGFKHRELIEDTGAVIEDDQLFINRTVKEDGKTRAVLGGKSTPTSVLANATANLISIHGQSDQIRLKSEQAQREALDSYAKEALTKPVAEYKTIYKSWKSAEKQLRELQENADAREREYRDLLAFTEEYARVDPLENEIEKLEQEIKALANLDDLKVGVASATVILNPEDNYEAVSPETQLEELDRVLAPLCEFDGKLESIHQKLEKALDLLGEVSSDLDAYAQSLDEDGLERLYTAQERLQELLAFSNKYRKSLDELAAWHEASAERLKELDPEANSIEDKIEEVAELHKRAVAAAAKVTEVRSKGARKLEKEVDEELKGLAMASSNLVITLSETPLSSNGADAVAFMLTSFGAPKPRPISKAASGGELSRIMLALEVVLADPTETPTFVFDEIDSGVGGETAIEIGKRLAKLSHEAQVIVVTHLAQVAAFANQHLHVSKTIVGEGIETTVEKLDEEGTVEELTRMLSGMSGSTTGQAHAQELMALAEQHKAAV